MKKPVVATVFVLSVAGAGFAAIHMMAPKTGAATPKEQILAATMPLSAGTLLRAQDVTWQGVAETETGEVVRPNSAALATKPELDEQTRTSVYGAVLRHPLQAGAPIRRDDIVKPGDRDFLQVVLTPGERAIAIPVATGGASTMNRPMGPFWRAKTCSTAARTADLRALARAVRRGSGLPLGFLRWICERSRRAARKLPLAFER